MKIKYDKRNFRKHGARNKELIRKSLSELGAGRSVLLDAEDSLIAGNGVYEQAEKLGIPVRVIETDGTELIAVKRTDVHEDDEKRMRLAVADNATSDTSEWDLDAIGDVDPVVLKDWDVNVGELQGGASDSIQGPSQHKEAEEDDFDEQKDAIATKCKPGEIWHLGEHRLMCGDSTNAEDITALMAGEQADLWLTDPPYNIDYEGKTNDKLKIQNDSMKDGDFRKFLLECYGRAFDAMKPGASFYIFHADSEGYNFRAALLDCGQKIRQTLIWNKNRMTLGRQDYQWKHEPCLYGWKDGASHKWYGDRKQVTVIDWNRPSRSDEHPTMKPVGLFGYLMQNSSKPGDIVLDSFGGSGTTLIAAEQLGRKARLMELVPHYCDVILARWEKMTGKQAQKIQ